MAEVGEDGKDPSVVLGCRPQPQLDEDTGHMTFHGGNAYNQPVCDPPIGQSLRHEHEHLSLTGRQLTDRAFDTWTVHHATNHLWIQG